MSSREQDVAEPSAEGGNYEAQAGSSTPVAPSRERQPRTEESPQPQANDPEAIDERAATTKTQPMARLQGAQQPSKHSDRSDGLIQDHRWEYFAGRWDSIQSGFVDDPRRAWQIGVTLADGFVGAPQIQHHRVPFRGPGIELRVLELEGLQIIPLQVRRFEVHELFQRLDVGIPPFPPLRLRSGGSCRSSISRCICTLVARVVGWFCTC